MREREKERDEMTERRGDDESEMRKMEDETRKMRDERDCRRER